ncbi:MAG TPA: immunoglobulin domain-containing protein, partial [Verrucomicrobiae bacterium]|nr:immunoglobulin domain-containing protein [Verrucomicrobiae bacterium]
IGPVVISEIHYHPRAHADEFLELRNLTTASVPLYDPAHPTNGWKMSGAGMTFSNGISLSPQGTLLLVADNPAAFRSRFGVPANVPILQYAGNLQDSGENLELQAPDAPTTNGVPYYVVDRVRYNDRVPWPAAADGAGPSLQRVTLSAYGDDPPNWTAATPTPGVQGLSGSPPAITSQPASRTNVTGSTATFQVSANGTSPLRYQWRHDGANLGDATNATLVLPNLTLTDAGAYSVVLFNQAGSTESQSATLIVRAGPSIAVPPTNFFIRVPPDPLANPAARATFSVTAVSYNPPLRYQWLFNGAPIPDATNTTYSFTNVTLAKEGAYAVVVTDSVGPTTSTPATLTGLVTPVFVLTPVSQSVVTGAVVTLSAAVTGNPLPFTWEWRRNANVQFTVTNLETTSYYSFLNTNAVDSSQLYRVLVRSLSGTVVGSATIITLRDSDGDGLPDDWETFYGLRPEDPNDAARDDDHDGMSNLSEYRAGTDPNNPLSFLTLSLSTVPGQNATVNFGAISNRTYTIEYADQPGATWRKLADVPALTNNRIESIPDPSWKPSRFYRSVTPRQP